MKKFISIFLITAMLFSVALCGNASATSELTIYQDLKQFIHYNDYYLSIRGICRPFSFDDQKVPEALKKAEDIFYDETSTDEDYLIAYNILYSADYDMIIAPDFAEGAYNLALKEQNYNNWYSDEDWERFETTRASLGKALETKLDTKISNAFYDMLYSYNVMTNRYTLKGDINKDGVVNIMDVTLIQKYLVGDADLTGAQKMLTSAYNYENININEATTIQKYSINLLSEMPNNKVFLSDFETYESDERITERAMNFIICPRTNDGIYNLRNGYYDTQFLEEYYFVTNKDNK